MRDVYCILGLCPRGKYSSQEIQTASIKSRLYPRDIGCILEIQTESWRSRLNPRDLACILEIQDVSQRLSPRDDQTTRRHNREHPVGLYRRLVRQLLPLQREGRAAQRITTCPPGGKLPALQDTNTTRCHRKAIKIISGCCQHTDSTPATLIMEIYGN